ncbi:GTP-binding protein Obg [hydrothermal vent metagenome]|uniref:GTP-binding protein Obg n=1 Tax=hydrothermal vent metagenome TaxID=652676 RepID=A0A3B0TIV1_9ZZZZ
MAFVDELNIFIKAGDGGDGVVRWRHEKGREFGGPSGGNGGSGGDVYVLGVRDINILAKYKHKKEFIAKDGEEGRKDSEHGADGEELTIPLPMGSIVTNHETGEKFSLEKEGEKILILKGGKGGRGNETFKSSTNQNPQQWTPGQKGQQADFSIELELIVDAGLIGLPNAGKSSLLNTITGAKAKTADYPFTTLEPNLGVLYGYILADIPGLIEGASAGKGLGHKFLRHVKRTKKLLHLISLESEDVLGTYETVRKELRDYDKTLAEKQEIIVLTKTDLVDKGTLQKTVAQMSKYGEVYTISIYDDDSLKILTDGLVKTLRKITRMLDI